jgi:hypothetical protein
VYVLHKTAAEGQEYEDLNPSVKVEMEVRKILRPVREELESAVTIL